MSNVKAIPFEKAYKPMSEATAKNVKAAIDTIKGNEKLTVKLLDANMPVIVGAVIGGDNIVIINDMLRALKGERRKFAEGFLKTFVPHEFRDNGLFGKKLAAPKAKAKERAFRKWEATGESYSDWGKKNMQVAKKPVDYGKRIENDIKAAMEKGGLTSDQVLAIVMSVVEAPAEAATA